MLCIESYRSSLVSFPITKSFWNYSDKPLYQLAKIPITPFVALFDSTIGRFINAINTYQNNSVVHEYEDLKISLNNTKTEINIALKKIAFTIALLAISAIFNNSILIGIGITTLWKTIETSFLFGFKIPKLLKNNPLKNIEKYLEKKQIEGIPINLKKDLIIGLKNFNKGISVDKNIGYCILRGPIIEELIFRGGLQSLIKYIITCFLPNYVKISAKIAIIVSGIIFGLMHINNSKKNAFLAGISGCLILGPLMEKYGIFTSIASHITGNTLLKGSNVLIVYYNSRLVQSVAQKLC